MKRIASLLLISAAAAALLALSTKKCNGDWLWESADGSEKDIDVHVTVPANVNCTVTPDYSRPSRAWRALVADLCVVRRREPTRVDLLLTP